MQHLLAIALNFFALLLNLAPTAAKHAECYWKGPGVGTPESQGFSVFGTGKKRIYQNSTTSIVEYYCDDYADKPVVANWGALRPKILEINTPCGGHGYSGDCSYGLWAVKLNGFTDHNANEFQPVRYLRKTDDCEWIGPMDEDELPLSITVYHR